MAISSTSSKTSRRAKLAAALLSYRGRTEPRTDLILGLAAFIIFLGIWYVIVLTGLVSARFLPLPGDVIGTLFRLLGEASFLNDVWISVARVWGAFFLSAVMAVPIGIWMSSYRIVGSLLEPVIDFIRYLPVPALVPLLIIWFGIGEGSKIAVLWMGTFFQLVLLVADDAKRIPREFIETGYTLGAKPSQITKHIVLPAMLPSLVDNLRITLGWCWTWIIVAEIVAANSGIGHYIWSMRRFLKTPEVMAGILAIGIIGLLTDQAIRVWHRRHFKYL